MRKLLLILVLFVVAMSVGGCGGDGQSVTSQATGRKMMNALFEGRWDDAQALALPEFSDKVSEDLSAFKALYEKYDFREAHLGELSRPWNAAATGDQETDRQLDVNFQYSQKGADSWRSGVLQFRAKVNKEGLWGIGAIKLIFPSR
jgi:hypothetical protein